MSPGLASVRLLAKELVLFDEFVLVLLSSWWNEAVLNLLEGQWGGC